jgi:hypothetical protein
MLRDAGGFVRQKPILLMVLAGICIALSGCGTTPAKEFGGRWKPVNRFASETVEIPLYSSYVFQAVPMDRTLKTMLERWARDTGMKVDYRLGSDYTLHAAVQSIGTTDVQQALSEINSAYSTQSISISLVGNSLVVASVGEGA